MPSVSRGETEALTTKRGGNKLLKVGVVLGVLLAGLAAGVFFGAPVLGAKLAVSAIEQTQSDGTTSSVESVRLSWSGPQRFTGLRLNSPDGHEGEFEGTLDQTLMALLMSRGKGDLGTVVVRGRAKLNADALAPTKPEPTDLPPQWEKQFEPIPVGKSFAMKLEIDEIDLEFTSTIGPKFTGKVSGDFLTRAGETSSGTLLLELTPPSGSTATVRADISIDGLVSHTGDFSIIGLETETSLSIEELPTSLGVYLPGLPSDLDLEQALGERMEGEIELDGRLGEGADATLTVRLSSENAQIRVNTRLAHGMLSPVGENTLRVETQGLITGWPSLEEWISQQSISINEAPEIEIAFGDFEWTESDDLRGSRADLEIRISRTQFDMPGERLTGREELAAVELEPATLEFKVIDGSLKLVSTIESSIDNTSAGVIDLDLLADGFLTDRGRLTLTKIPGLTGTITLTEVPSGLLQPLVPEGSGLDLARDLGSTVTSSVVAHAEPGEPTRIAIDVRSKNFKLNGSMDLNGSQILVDPSVGVEVVINRLSPTMAELLGPDAVAEFKDDQGATLSLTRLEIDLDALARSGFTDPEAVGLLGTFSVLPFTLDVADHDPLQVTMTYGDVSMNAGVLSVQARTEEVRYGEFNEALRRAVIDTRTDWLQGGAPRTETKLSVQILRTVAAGAWLGEQTPLGAALTRINDRMLLEAEPVFEGGRIVSPFAFDGEDLGLTGTLTLDTGQLGGEFQLDITDTQVLDTAFELDYGVSTELLGKIASVKVVLDPESAEDESQTETLTRARVSLLADRMESIEPVRVVIGPEGLVITEPAEVRTRLTPRAFDLLRGHTEDSPAEIRLGEPALVTLKLAGLNIPTESSPLLDATLTASPLVIERVGEASHRYSAFETRIQSVPDQPNDLRLTATLEEGGRPVINFDLIASSLLAQGGTLSDETPAYTGTVTLTQAQTSLLDLIASSDTISGLLGPTADADLTLENFPRDGGTLEGTVSSPRATGSISALAEGGEIMLTEPARLELSEITQTFSYEFAPMIPMIGSLTKDPSIHKPASITIDALHVPVPFDLSGLNFNASIDPGTASILAESGLAEFIRGNPTIGDSFTPFGARMQGGVLRVTDLVIPLGEFRVPAHGSYDLVNRTEDIFVQIPAASLLAEGIGGDQSAVEQILSQFLRVGLRKDGSLGVTNEWRVDVDSSSGSPSNSNDPVRDGILDLLDQIGG